MGTDRFLAGLVLGALSLVSSAAAQGQVWVVDDDLASSPDFTDLQAAVDAVADGDVLLVKAGLYGTGLVIDDQELTIQAEGAVRVDGARAVVRNLASGKRVQLRGIEFDMTLEIRGSRGTVWVEDCRVRRPNFSSGLHGIVVDDCDSVILIGTDALGQSWGDDCLHDSAEGGHGLWMSRSSVHAYGCNFDGGDGGAYFDNFCPCCRAGQPGSGVYMAAAPQFLLLSDCTAVGGDGGPGDLGCSSGAAGLRASGSVYLQASALEGGRGAGSCADGLPSAGPVTVISGEVLRLTAPSPVREGNTVQFGVQGPPNVPVWLVMSTASDGTFFPSLEGSILIRRPAVLYRFLGTTDATGALSHTEVVPSFRPATESILTFWQLAAITPSAGIQVAEGTMILALDQAF